jgi:hypothetical protein
MRHAGHERSAIAPTTFSTPSDQSVGTNGGLVPRRELVKPLTSGKLPPPTEVVLSPGGTFVSGISNEAKSAEDRSGPGWQLAVAIHQRIETRLGGRVRNLSVRFNNNTIVLEGECSTYYTKQLAQHAALGVLED